MLVYDPLVFFLIGSKSFKKIIPDLGIFIGNILVHNPVRYNKICFRINIHPDQLTVVLVLLIINIPID